MDKPDEVIDAMESAGWEHDPDALTRLEAWRQSWSYKLLKVRWAFGTWYSAVRRNLRLVWYRVTFRPIFRHSRAMGEISGFGGGYEALCQDMLEAGCLWLHADGRWPADFQLKESPSIFGVAMVEGRDADALEAACMAASRGEATGAMHHAVMRRLWWINQQGWPAYVQEMTKAEAESD